MKRFALLLVTVLLVGAWADSVPKVVDEARRDLKQAQEQLQHAQELLDKGGAPSTPGVLERAKDKVKDMFSTTPPTPVHETESLLTKLRNYFRPAPETVDTAARASHTVSDAAGYMKDSAKETAASLAEKVKRLFGSTEDKAHAAKSGTLGDKASESAESLLEKLRSLFAEGERAAEASKPAAQAGAQYAGDKASETTETLAGKIKQALGVGPKHEESLGEKIKHSMGIGTEAPHEGLADKIKHSMGIGTEAPREGLADKIKHSLGMESAPSESLGDRIKHSLGIGAVPEETLGEKIKSGVKSAMGVDTTGVAKPNVLERLRSYFGYHQPTTAEKMKEAFDTSISQARANIEEKIAALRKATGTSRNTAYQDLLATLDQAKTDLLSRTDTIYDAFLHPIDTVKDAAKGVADKISGESVTAEEKPGLLRRARDDMAARINSLYDTIATSSRGWASDLESMTERVKTAFGRGNSYLLQSSNYEDGVTTFYVNDNGNEFLDATGQNVDKLDKLKVLNEFRTQYSLPKYESLPANVSIQTYPLKRAHVLIKSSRLVDGNQFDYVYDDGEETLSVIWAGEEPKIFTKDVQHRILDSFRQLHGLTPSTKSVPVVRARLAKISEKKDEL